MSEDAEEPGWRQPSAPSSNIGGAMANGSDLVIKFKSGHIYSYPGQAGMLDDLLGAESAGRFFYRHLKHRMGKRLDRS